jgi:uncharacterized integral membrane protein
MKPIQWFRIAVLILIGIIAVVLVVRNAHTTTLFLLFWQLEIPVILLVPGLLLIGFLAGYMTRAFIAARKARLAQEAAAEPPAEPLP